MLDQYTAYDQNAAQMYNQNYWNNKNYGLQQQQQNEAQRQFNATYRQNNQQFNTTTGLQRQQMAQNQNQFNQNLDFQKQRATVGDTQWQKEFDEGVRQFNKNSGRYSGGGSNRYSTPQYDPYGGYQPNYDYNNNTNQTTYNAPTKYDQYGRPINNYPNMG
jgi:hypothetical protein